MKKTYIVLAIIALILIIAALTNPSPQRHKEAVKEKLTAYMDDKVKDSSALGAMFGGALIQVAVDRMVTSDNYLFFSLTKVA